MVIIGMFLTIMSGVCLIVLGMAGFIGWEQLGATGSPAEMLMPVFFGGAILICAAFSRIYYRHGLYGGLLVAILGVVSSVIRINQYGNFQDFSQPKTRIILAMGGICILQMLNAWQQVKKNQISQVT